MKAWNFDAGSIYYSKNLYDEVYINRQIKNYLNVSDHDHNFFLVGPKGIGKTLFLNFKSYLYNEKLKNNGVKKYPSGQNLCENLSIKYDLFSKEDLLKFSTSEIWSKIWFFTLCVISCQTNDIELPEELNKKIDYSKSLTSIITNILMDRSNIADYISFIPKLISKIEEIQNAVGIFIDNVDQCFNEILSEYHYSDFTEDIPISVKVWTNAQIGLISSIYNINKHNSHIKIYTTIRSEVFKSMNDQMNLNYQNYATFIKYNKAEIKEIFELNIKLQEDEDILNYPKGNTLIEKFLGFEIMPHLFAKDKLKKKKNEFAFDFFYRHTFGRPRELVFLGNKIYNEILSSNELYDNIVIKDKIEKIRMATNEISHQLFEQYILEIIPSFDKDTLTEFLDTIQCNVIPSECITESNKKIIKKYYSYGLIGHSREVFTDKKKNDILTQMFLPPAEYSYKENINLPNAKYYFTHPSIDNTFKILFGLNFYNKNNIIGNEYEFIDIPNLSRIYDVALSFAGEDRNYVEQVAGFLKNMKIRVFYDDHEKTDLWGKDLYQHLDKIYRLYAKYCVVFCSKSYIKKRWTNHELKSAQVRAFEDNEEYILPAKFDNSEIPGLRTTVGYLDLNKLTPEQLAEQIKKKIKSK